MTTISALPTPPSTSSPSTFDALADAFIAALPVFVTETNAVAGEINAQAAIVVPAQAALDEALPSILDFNSTYLGASAVAPSLDNNGNPLAEGVMYFDSVNNIVKIWDGFAWQTSAGVISPNFSILREVHTATSGQTVFNLANSFVVGTNTVMVYIQGVRQFAPAYTETGISQITFSAPINLGDKVLFEIGVVAAGSNVLAGNTTFSPVAGNSATNVQEAITNVQTQVNSMAGNSLYLAQFSAI